MLGAVAVVTVACGHDADSHQYIGEELGRALNPTSTSGE